MGVELIEFITKSSLYSRFKIVKFDLTDFMKIHNGEIKYESFCSKCGSTKVFTYDTGLLELKKANLANILKNTRSPLGADSRYTEVKESSMNQFDHIYIRFKCSLNESHKQEYYFAIEDESLVKVGQFPSSADLDLPQASKYRSILGKQYYDELKRAIGLYSHGVGIGSFVYLRRIIEKLVYDAFSEAEAAGKLTKAEFEYQEDGKHRNGIEVKIKLLKGILPDLITENPKIYGIVSKGIHELSEEICSEYFSVLKNGIIMILDAIVEKKEKVKAEEEYRKSLGAILSKHS
ncbi:hypothetical protein [Fusibacter bizertensis]